MNEQTDYIHALLAELEHTQGNQTIEKLQAAAEQHPNDARPLLLLAAEFMHIGKLDKAEATYTIALGRAPDFAIARFQLGLLQFSSGRSSMAIVTWSRLDALADDHYLKLFKTGFLTMGAGNYDEALKLFQTGIKANSENPPLNHDIQKVIQKLQNDHALNALESEAIKPSANESHLLVSAYRNNSL